MIEDFARTVRFITKERKTSELQDLYSQIPDVTGCNQCGRCCTSHVRLAPAELLNIPIDAWAQYPNQAKRCRFVNADGSCGIYEHRPFVCRAWGIDNNEGCVRTVEPVSGQEIGRLWDVYQTFSRPCDLRIMT